MSGFQYTTCAGDSLKRIIVRANRGKKGLEEFIEANPKKREVLLVILKDGKFSAPLKKGVKFFFPRSWGMPEEFEVSDTSTAGVTIKAEPSHTYQARILVKGAASWALTESTIKGAIEGLGFRDVVVYSADSLPPDWPADQKERVKSMWSDTIFVKGTWTKEAQVFDTSSDPNIELLWIQDITPKQTQPQPQPNAPQPAGPIGPDGRVWPSGPSTPTVVTVPEITIYGEPNATPVIDMPTDIIHASPPAVIAPAPVTPTPTPTPTPAANQPFVRPEASPNQKVALGVFALALVGGTVFYLFYLDKQNRSARWNHS